MDEINNIFGKRLNDLMEEYKINQAELSDRLFLTGSALSNYIRGTRIPRIETIIEMCKIFDVSMDYLFGLTDSKSRTKYLIPEQLNIVMIPVLNYYYNNDSLNDSELRLQYIHISKDRFKNNSSLFGLKIHSPLMRPRLYEGDIVLVERTKTIKDGDLIVVTIGEESAIVRELTTTSDGWVLNPFTPVEKPTFYSWDDIEKESIRLIGRVVESITFYK